jgi:perosamine synthetase
MTTGEGGMVVPSSPEVAARLRSERNQGRAADMGWLDHGGLGFNYRLGDLAAALGVAQVEKLDSLLERRGALAATYAERLDALDGVEAPSAGRGAERRSWFVYPVRLAAEADRDAPVSPSAASRARRTSPASTSFHTCASSAIARASSLSPKRHPADLSPCPSSPR